MDVLVDAVCIVAGVALILVAVDSAIRTFVLPRGVAVPLTTAVFVTIRRFFNLIASRRSTYEGRDAVMALYAPTALVILPAIWITLVVSGFTLINRGLGVTSWRIAFQESGSSLLTLGFVRPSDLPKTVVAFSEAAIGLFLLALLISYLPTIYAAFSRREVLVAHMSARAGEPPEPVDLLVRAYRIERLFDLDDLWVSWQLWFAELEETHTSLASLTFFRSPKPDRSWITAAGCVLDSAALVNSTVQGPWQPMAALCIRSGFTALRSIADFFGIAYDPDPAPTDPISIAREEWEDVCRRLEAVGVPLKDDREQAWRDFAGWRVNYDRVLIALAGLTMAPYAPWSSDRSFYQRPRIRWRSGRQPRQHTEP